MSNKSPIFPISQPQHFSDYGFDPQIDYFQVLKEAKKHKNETRNIDAIHFKHQKPISKDDSKKRKWWKKALFFFKRSWTHNKNGHHYFEDVHQVRTQAFRASISGPVYITESTSRSSTPYRNARRSSSGPLRKGEMNIPYLSLRDLSMEQQLHPKISFPAMPIYLVT